MIRDEAVRGEKIILALKDAAEESYEIWSDQFFKLNIKILNLLFSFFS